MIAWATTILLSVAYVTAAFSTHTVERFWSPDGSDSAAFIHTANAIGSDVPYHERPEWPNEPGRTPIYPAMLALSGMDSTTHSPIIPIAWNLLALVGIGVISTRLAEAFGVSRYAAIYVVAAALPHALMVMSDVMALLFLYGGMLAGLTDDRRLRYVVASGALLGLAALTRNAAGIWMAVVPVIGLLLRRRTLRRAALSVAVSLTVVSPWMIYHHSRTGSYALGSFGLSHMLFTRTIPGIAARGNLGAFARSSDDITKSEVAIMSGASHQERVAFEWRMIGLFRTTATDVGGYLWWIAKNALIESNYDWIRPWGIPVGNGVRQLQMLAGLAWLHIALNMLRRRRLNVTVALLLIVLIPFMQVVLAGFLTMSRIMLPASIGIAALMSPPVSKEEHHA